MTREQLLTRISEREGEIFLDDLIHDVHSHLASEINNQGPEGQVDWLLAHGESIESIDEHCRQWERYAF